MMRRHSRRGFTLVELLCVMMLILLVMTLSTLLIRGIIQIEQSQAASFDRLMQQKALADQFRADVAAAEDAPKTWEAFKADAATLILRHKDGEHVVYLWRLKSLRRQAHGTDKLAETALPIGGDNVEIEFGRSETEPRLLRLYLHSLHQGKRAEGQTLPIEAALGGDRR